MFRLDAIFQQPAAGPSGGLALWLCALTHAGVCLFEIAYVIFNSV